LYSLWRKTLQKKARKEDRAIPAVREKGTARRELCVFKQGKGDKTLKGSPCGKVGRPGKRVRQPIGGNS